MAAASAAGAADLAVRTQAVPWQQVDAVKSFVLMVEREEFSNLDRQGRVVFAVQVGKGGPKLDELSVRWRITREGKTLVDRTDPIDQGLLSADFPLDALAQGRYEVSAELTSGQQTIDKAASFFRLVQKQAPPQKGRIALHLPQGVPIADGTFPVTCGVPFAKGALSDPSRARIVDARGAAAPCQTVVRSRWGSAPDAGIRWLGLDFQAGPAKPWWPEKKETSYFVEFGPDVTAPAPQAALRITDTAQGIEVDTGPLRFLVRRQGFNLIDQVRLDGRPVLQNDASMGAYLVDHEGAVYRAANDRGTTLAVEEQGPLRAVLRAEGWYVKDGTAGEKLSYTLPTDRLCKFVTRVEAYAGKPYVRILHTWVLTYDTFTVRLRDVGLALGSAGSRRVEFGVEGGQPVQQAVGDGGARLVQHMPHEFAVEDGSGRELAKGRHSAGWMLVENAGGVMGVGLREAWQRFPKEFEALPGEVRLHIWPAHGREHPGIRGTDHNQIHKLWFAHQGKELNLAMPWEYYFAVCKIMDEQSLGVYSGPGLSLAGVHASGLGAAVTSDCLVHFAPASAEAEVRDVAGCFQARPHALPDPVHLCGTLAMGRVQPHSPTALKQFEEIIEDAVKGYRETQDASDEYGMWVYRSWHHANYLGDGKWRLYRLYNTTHHYEAFMPWMLYARSGDPFYFDQGMANIRLLTDVQAIHYDDPSYPQREFHFGQGRLVGSTRHTNGFGTWGGDHAVLAHLTCYNGAMLAYYLTGDLRLREFVVDEWQNSILNDRANPQLAEASRLHPGRDNNNALGELIDLYQLTYHPALLALIEPMLKRYLDNMYHWGLPHENVVSFLGNSQARQQIVDGCAAYRTKAGNPDDPKSLWRTHAPHGVLALASILDPDSDFHVHAFWAADPMGRREWARRIRRQEPAAVAFCSVPDYIVYLPRVMYALARKADELTLEKLSTRQPMPAGDNKLQGWLRCVVREDRDQDFDVALSGEIGKDGVPVRVYGPDNQKLQDVVAPEGACLEKPWKLTIPKDGKTGQYVIFVKARDQKDKLFVPFTELPGEVYCPGYWAQFAPTRFYTRSRGEKPETLVIQPHKTPASIIDAADEKVLASTTTGERLDVQIGPGGALVDMRARYVSLEKPLPLSVSPSRWFAPQEDKLTLKP